MEKQEELDREAGRGATHVLRHGQEVLQHLHTVPVHPLLLKRPPEIQQLHRIRTAPQPGLPGAPLFPPALLPRRWYEPLL